MLVAQSSAFTQQVAAPEMSPQALSVAWLTLVSVGFTPVAPPTLPIPPGIFFP
jgi:hypothetical protein